MLLFFSVICLGFGLIFCLPKSLHNYSKLLLFPALGILTFTQILLYLAFPLGVNYLTIGFSLLLLFFVSIVIYFKWKSALSSEEQPNFSYFLILVISVLIGFLWLKQTAYPRNGSLFSGGGGMYGDTALHAAYTSRLEAGSFPPQNPLFAGRTLVYPFANDLFSAVIKKTGLNLNLSFTLPQFILLLAFLVLYYEVCLKFTDKSGFLISLIFLLLGWGIGGFIFLGKLSAQITNFSSLLNTDFTDNSQYGLFFHNITTGLILPERSFLPGLVLGLLFFLNYFEYESSKKIRYLVINGLILGSLTFWHTHTFIFFTVFALFVSYFIFLKEKNKKEFFRLSSVFYIAFILATPFIVLFLKDRSAGSFLHFSYGWQNSNQNLFMFWLRNSFLTLPLAIVGIFFVSFKKKLFLVPAFIVFLLANVVIFQPWDWDNIKLLSWSFVFFSILAAIALKRLTKYGHLGLFLVVCILFVSSLSGVLSVISQTKNEYVIYDKADIDLAAWIQVNTGKDDVFISDPTPNNPIPSLGARMLYLGYPGHLWVHGINYSQREITNASILNGNLKNINELEVPISYIVTTKNTQANIAKIIVYENEKYSVYKN